VRLDPGQLEAIAIRVAELILERTPEPSVRYIDAAELARVLGVERNWVYAHARQLGAVRLGRGRGRLRFDLQHVTRAISIPDTTVPALRLSSAPRQRRRPAAVDLLPYES
jgi:plasmid replication initiation protein